MVPDFQVAVDRGQTGLKARSSWLVVVLEAQNTHHIETGTHLHKLSLGHILNRIRPTRMDLSVTPRVLQHPRAGFTLVAMDTWTTPSRLPHQPVIYMLRVVLQEP